MGQNLTTSGKLVWAMNAEGLDPLSKLVLIILADGSDEDGHWFEPYDTIRRRANVDDLGLGAAIGALTVHKMACFSVAESPATGEQAKCICLLTAGGIDGV